MKRLLAIAALCTSACDGAGPAAEGSPVKTYESDFYRVTVDVPADWQQTGSGRSDEGVAGPSGRLKFSALSGPPSLGAACATEAGHRLKPFGPNPRIETGITVAGQPACRIVPTATGAANERVPAGIVVTYAEPLQPPGPAHAGSSYPFLVIEVDPPHLPLVERSLRFRQ